MKIFCIGLGSRKNDITLRAAECVRAADKVVLKTSQIPSAEFFKESGIPFISCDSLFEQAENFDTLNERICDFLSQFSCKTLAFCVHGGGASDRTVQKLLADFPDTEFIPGVNAAETLMSKSPSGSAQAFSAPEFLSLSTVNTEIPLAVYELDNALLASDVITKLTEFFDDETPVILFNGGKLLSVPLFEVLRQKKWGLDSAVLVPPQPFKEKANFGFGALMDILRVLRAPDGCPWDREQTHESLRANVIEEAYELAAAIDNKDEDNLIEELGDCLLQVFFHTEIAREAGRFGYKEVLNTLCKKLVSRHTHIFGEDKASGAGQALEVWEKNKAKEKGVQTVSESMSGISKALPALTRAAKIQKKAAKAGFDWPSADGAFDKIAEEIEELKSEMKAGVSERAESESGDLLFAAVNACRFAGVQPEVALNRANEKFIRRFTCVENKLSESGRTDATLEEMDALWEEAKRAEKCQ